MLGILSPTSATSRRFSLALVFGLPVALLVAARALADDWPHWRGAGRSDIVSESSGWTGGDWAAAKPVWSLNVGTGSTSPIVVSGRMYVMGWRSGKDYLQCLDAATGKQIWRQTYACPDYGRRSTGDKGIYSGPSSTPSFDKTTGHLYSLSIDGELNCWDTNRDGAKIWGVNLYDKYDVAQRPDVGSRKNTLRDYGYTSSPLVYQDWIIVEVGDDTGTVMAFDKKNGKQLWTSQCKDPAAHTGGLVPITVEGVPCVAVLTIHSLVVMRLDRGHEGRTVAEYKWTTDFANNIPTPAVEGHHIIVTSAYNQYAICKLEITLRGAKPIWTNKELASGVCSPVIHKGHVYWAWRGVHCLDLATGKEKWSGGNVGTQGSCIVTSDDRLIVWSNRGDLQLVETAERSPNEFKVVAERNRMFATDVWPHIVLADGWLYCKDRDGNLICLALSGAAAKLTENPPPPSTPRPDVKPVDLKSWPGDDESVVFAWHSSLGADKVLGSASAKGKVKLTARDSARLDKDGMELSEGAILVDGANDALLAACKPTGQLTIEAVLESHRARQTGPARIISFSSDGYSRNFSLAQDGDTLMLRLRTPQTGNNGMQPETKLCRIVPDKQYHIVVTYRDGQLDCYLDGKKVHETSAVHGDFSNWSDQHLLFGDEWDGGGTRDWSGRIERVALLNRFVGENEAAQRFQRSGRGNP